MTASKWLWSDYQSTTVSSGGATTPVSGSSETWTVSSSTGFPAASNSASPPSVFDIADPALPSEVIRVTNVSGTTWTVTRGADSTTPVSHAGGFTIWLITSSGALANMVQSGNVASLGATTVSGGFTTDSMTVTGTNGSITGGASFVASDATNFIPQAVDGDGINYDVGRLTRLGAGPQTINTTGYNIISGFGCTIQNGVTYFVDGQIICNSLSGSGNPEFRFDGSASVSNIRCIFMCNNSASGAPNQQVDTSIVTGIGSGNNCTLTAVQTFATNEFYVTFQGILQCSAQGTILLRAACSGSGSYSIEAFGTYMNVYPCTT